MSNIPLSLKTPPVNNNDTASTTSATSRLPGAEYASKSKSRSDASSTVAVSQNVAAIVNLPQSARPEVLSRSGNDAILRVGTSVMSVSGLKQDLQTVQRHIGFERERRLEAEKLYAAESESLLDKEQAEAVSRREEELARLHEERTSMIEFLQRGTGEAKRISAEVASLKIRANEREAEETELAQERLHLDNVLERLNHELSDHANQFASLAKNKEDMERRQVELNALAASTEQQSATIESKLEQLRKELDTRLVAARRVEQLESAMAVISACSRRLQHELEHINTNVVKISDDRLTATASGDAAQSTAALEAELEAATIAPDFDSEVEAEDTRVTSVVGATARTKLARCSSIIKAMLTALLRYDMEIAARMIKIKKSHEEAVNGAHKYLRETRNQIDDEAEQWNQKYHQREDQLRKANDFRNRAVTDSLRQQEEALADLSSGGGADGSGDGSEERPAGGGRSAAGKLAAEKALLESSFSLTQYFERIMNETAQERNSASAENEKLKVKVNKYQKDYALVKELRNQFRELETQKISLESTLRAAEEENRQLRTVMGGGIDGGRGGGGANRGPGSGDVFGFGEGGDDGFGSGVGPNSSNANRRRTVGVAGSNKGAKPSWRSNTFN
jgi:hypothetical protein